MADSRETQKGGVLPVHDYIESVLSQIPKDHPVRIAVDEAILNFIYLDARTHSEYTGSNYRPNRNGVEYVKALRGLYWFFRYLRKLKTSEIVLDVGAGTTEGANDLANSALSLGMDIHGVVLRKIETSRPRLPDEKIHETSVEYLNGMEQASVAGVIGMASITYSMTPEFTVRRIDQVLVPGGAIKASFKSLLNQNPLAQTHHKFSAEMSRLEYDVAIKTGKHWDILLGIKPGSPYPTSSQLILDQDAFAPSQQLKYLREQKYPTEDNGD